MASSSSCRIYRIDHKCLSNTHKFEIFNDKNEILYIVHSNNFLLLSDKIFLCEVSSGKELIKIAKETLHIHLRYDISKMNDNDEQHLGTVKRISNQHYFENTFEIDSIYGVYKVERDNNLFNHQFKLTTGNKIVVDVTKHVQENIYDVQINDDDGGDIFLLSIVIAIWCAQRSLHL
jgi:uncharacterized protein YxjI